MTIYRKFRDDCDYDDVEMCLACNNHMVCPILFGERNTSEIKNCPCYTCLVAIICQDHCKKRNDYAEKLYKQDDLGRNNHAS